MNNHPIIRRILSIDGMGVFNGRAVDSSTPDFKGQNLIYGFNGSGKTTLSRIMLSIAGGALHPALPADGRFRIVLSDNVEIDSSRMNATIASRIFVFNVDFVEENIHWYDSTANPVYYIGKTQADLALIHDQLQAQALRNVENIVETQSVENTVNSQLVTHKQDLARLIAEALNLGRRYNATNLAVDYSQFDDQDLVSLSDDERQIQRIVINQESALPKINLLQSKIVKIEELLNSVSGVIQESVSLMLVDEIQQNPSMLPWFKTGLDYHSAQALTTCLFCGGRLHEDRIAALRSCIDRKFDDLMRKIEDDRSNLEALRLLLGQLRSTLPSINDFANVYQSAYGEARQALLEAIGGSLDVIERAELRLKAKALTPSLVVRPDEWLQMDEAASCDKRLGDGLSAINHLINQHNEIHDKFTSVKEIARTSLKKHLLSEGYIRYKELNNDLTSASAARRNLEAEQARLRQEIESVKAKIRQHGPAADRMTKLLSLYLGHGELEIRPLDAGYRISRKGRDTTGALSEGEKSALALCYFISMLEAEGRKLRELIVIVDDPVSSQDCNALNYAFSLLKNSLGSASQLIILTHNLHFMNEVKKWLRRGTENGKSAMFFVNQTYDISKGERSSSLIEMPKYLREYESEYHFLFKIVADFVDQSSTQDSHFHVMPNAMRKVLEIFLAFKIPGSSGLASKVEMLVASCEGIDENRLRALDRLVQVESHGDNLDDLISFSSITVEETCAAAKSLLSLIERVDPDHYRSMCKLCK